MLRTPPTNPLPIGVYHDRMVDRPTKNHLRIRLSGDRPSPRGWVRDSETIWVPRELVGKIRHCLHGWRRVTTEVLDL